MFKTLLTALALSTAAQGSAASWFDMSPFDIRDRINQRILSIPAETLAVQSVEDHIIQNTGRNTPVRIYFPSVSEPSTIVLLIHGGAWMAGNIETHDNLARYLSANAECIVVSVGYLNAPEGKFPLQLEQSFDALNWIVANAETLTSAPYKIAVVGDNAGGNMSAALSLMARDRSGPAIDLQILINPASDLSCKGTLARQDDALDTLRYQAVQYLADPADAVNPYVSPLLAPDLTHLPNALVILAEKDDLREDGQHYADRLTAAGVDTSVYCQLGANQLAGDGARASHTAKESLDVAVKALLQLKAAPLTAQDLTLIDFYRGIGKDSSKRSLQDIWNFTLSQKESAHDYIQWLFPLKTASKFNSKAPVLTPAVIAAMQADPLILDNVRVSLKKMLEFYGLEWDANGRAIIESSTFSSRAKVWLNKNNHNHLRITRILTSLNLLGLDKESRLFYDQLGKIYTQYPGKIDPQTWKIWSSTQH